MCGYSNIWRNVPTVLWPKLRTDAAMSIGGQVALPDVTVEDIVREASLWSHPAERAREVATATVAEVTEAIAGEAIPPRSDVARFVSGRARRLLS